MVREGSIPIPRKEENAFGLLDHIKYPLYTKSEIKLPVDFKWNVIDTECQRLIEKENNKNGMFNQVVDCYMDERLHERAAAGHFDNEETVVFGDRLLENLLDTISLFKYKGKPLRLRPDQQTMISHCIVALLPLIYGPELNANRERLLKKFLLKRISQEVVLIASRRVGKSTMMSILFAALLLCMPGIEIACFSPALRQSRSNIMKSVIGFIMTHPDYSSRKIEKNSERLEVSIPKSERKNTITVYPDREEVC